MSGTWCIEAPTSVAYKQAKGGSEREAAARVILTESKIATWEEEK